MEEKDKIIVKRAQEDVETAKSLLNNNKNSNDTIRNQTQDLPARSTVPQPTATPRAPH